MKRMAALALTVGIALAGCSSSAGGGDVAADQPAAAKSPAKAASAKKATPAKAAAPAPAKQDPDNMRLGATFHGEKMDTTVSEVRKGVKGEFDSTAMVAAKVKQCATGDGAAYNPFFWKVVDRDGGEYNATVSDALKPSLQSGDLRPGKCVTGWVFFENPTAAPLAGVALDEMGVGDEATWPVK